MQVKIHSLKKKEKIINKSYSGLGNMLDINGYTRKMRML